MANVEQDKLIRTLQEEIKSKAAKLKDASGYVIQSNQNFNWYGIRYNILTMDKKKIGLVYGMLKSVYDASIAAFPDEDIVLDGNKLSALLSDMVHRYNVVDRKEQELHLKTLMDRATSLLSDDAKTADELAKLMKEIGL